MKNFLPTPQKLFLALIAFGCLAAAGYGQELRYNYHYTLSMDEGDEPPRITGIDDFVFPEAARKNGTSGTVKATLVLGEDGKTRDIVITAGLPDGISEGVTKILQTLYFQPGRLNGKAVPAKLDFEFVITATYSETDKAVTKAKVTNLPVPEYPPGEKIKGKVSVSVLVNEDGTFKVLGVSSVMPKEYDRAAFESAKNLQFTPAVHKKSKKNVAQTLTVDILFK